jgi:hypothetical protein
MKNGKEIANDLSRLVNTLSPNSPEVGEFIDEVLNDHRTLQQSTGGLVFKLIKGWADAYDAGNYDARNAHLCWCCAELVRDHPEMFKYGMPLI